MARVTNPHIRLGRGQVTNAHDSIWEARRAFLRAVHDVEPAVFRFLFPADSGQDALDAYRRQWNDDPNAMIAAWQSRWHLYNPWLAEVARNTLRANLKRHVQGVPVRLSRDAFVTPHARDKGAGAALGIPGYEWYWNRARETRQSVEERLIAAIKAELDRVELETTMPKPGRKSPEHFTWLARYQVLEETGQGITSTLPDKHPEKFRGVEERARAVQMAIIRTKDLIGLTLRDDPYRTPQ